MNQRNEPLSLEGEWEHIVNDVERHNARLRLDAVLRQRHFRKQLNRIIDCVLVAAAVIALDVAGLLASLVAMPTAFIFICIACFIAGCVWEQRRK